jgi:hypothetical protein
VASLDTANVLSAKFSQLSNQTWHIRRYIQCNKHYKSAKIRVAKVYDRIEGSTSANFSLDEMSSPVDRICVLNE